MLLLLLPVLLLVLIPSSVISEDCDEAFTDDVDISPWGNRISTNSCRNSRSADIISLIDRSVDRENKLKERKRRRTEKRRERERGRKNGGGVCVCEWVYIYINIYICVEKKEKKKYKKGKEKKGKDDREACNGR